MSLKVTKSKICMIGMLTGLGLIGLLPLLGYLGILSYHSVWPAIIFFSVFFVYCLTFFKKSGKTLDWSIAECITYQFRMIFCQMLISPFSNGNGPKMILPLVAKLRH